MGGEGEVIKKSSAERLVCRTGKVEEDREKGKLLKIVVLRG